jgi:hypothetical protein
MSQDLVKRLREHDDPRLYQEADVLMSEAADRIEEVTLERDRIKNALFMNALFNHPDKSHAEITRAIAKATGGQP